VEERCDEREGVWVGMVSVRAEEEVVVEAFMACRCATAVSDAASTE